MASVMFQVNTLKFLDKFENTTLLRSFNEYNWTVDGVSNDGEEVYEWAAVSQLFNL